MKEGAARRDVDYFFHSNINNYTFQNYKRVFNHLSAATDFRLTIGPEMALSKDSEMLACDLRSLYSLCLIEAPLLCLTCMLRLLWLLSQIGKWRSAASSAKIRWQLGHCFLMS